jgi:hypothetical protein
MSDLPTFPFLPFQEAIGREKKRKKEHKIQGFK